MGISQSSMVLLDELFVYLTLAPSLFIAENIVLKHPMNVPSNPLFSSLVRTSSGRISTSAVVRDNVEDLRNITGGSRAPVGVDGAEQVVTGIEGEGSLVNVGGSSSSDKLMLSIESTVRELRERETIILKTRR